MKRQVTSSMQLSDLVKLREDLDAFIDVTNIKITLKSLDDAVTNIYPKNADYEFCDYLDDLRKDIKNANDIFDKKISEVPEIKRIIDQKISDMSSKYFAANYQMELALTEEGERKTRAKAFSDHAKEVLSSRLKLYSDWHYPGLEIGPGVGVWTGDLVGNDPLYLIDIRQSYLDETIAMFTPEYQRRIRPYLIPESDDPEDLSILPQNQFGFVTSINVFEYFSFDKIRHYLEEVWNLLRPGGVFLFSYNNGERYQCAKLAENGTVSYIPKTMLVTFCETHGYEVIETFDLDNSVCWIELRKPGKLKTAKTHQAMGEIKFKTH